jgi:patatin-related protein
MPGQAKELRLGMVCYGGSSLCIYMHGVTKEVHRLLRASAGENGAPTEKVYTELIDTLSKEAGVDLRVIVDVIAGTSAGGINGIFLGKAIAGNRSQDALRDLWFNRGDMNELVIGPRKILGIKLGWKPKIPLLLRRALKRSPLRGDDMARWLHGALEQMDAPESRGDTPSLMPEAHPLDLWVTITDFYGYERSIPLSRPRFVPDSRHRHAVNFHYGGADNDEFSDNAALTFAARTTSCFPGVFPPVNTAELSKAIGASMNGLLDRSFRIYALSGANANATYFIDGGVLDNKPFGWATDTIILSRPATTEVDRRLLYLEPDPGGHAARQGGASPQTLAAAMGAAMSIPRSEPILDDLLEVQEHNERVNRIRDVIEANFERVGKRVDDELGNDPLASAPGEWPWKTWNDAMHKAAADETGAAYATYIRLKVSSVLDGFASSVCAICNFPAESNHAALVRAAVRAWGRGRGLYAGVAGDRAGVPRGEAALRLTDTQTEFLRAFDVGFVRRRLRFVIAALNWWYQDVGKQGFPKRAELDEGKQALYGQIATLDALARLRLDDADAERLRALVISSFHENDLTAFLRSHGPDGDRFAHDHKAELDNLFENARPFYTAKMAKIAPATLTEFARIAAGWDHARRRDLVVRYLGFPIWDVLIYPVQSLSQTGEGDAIDVVRMSPHEATLLPVPDGGKVEGTKFHHFYAFFHREARENDYLWGRLDAAEQLVRLLLDSSGSKADPKPWAKRLFEAVLNEEEQALTTVRGKVADLREAVAKI